MSTSIQPSTPPLPAEEEEEDPLSPADAAEMDAYVDRLLRWYSVTMHLSRVQALSGGVVIALGTDVPLRGSDVLARQGVRLEWTREVVEAVMLAGHAALPAFHATLLPVAAAVFLLLLPVRLRFPRPRPPRLLADGPEA